MYANASRGDDAVADALFNLIDYLDTEEMIIAFLQVSRERGSAESIRQAEVLACEARKRLLADSK